MGRLIDTDKLHYIMEDPEKPKQMDYIRRFMVDKAPTVDAEPIRHGQWLGIDDEPCEVFQCDKCGYITEEIGCADNKPNNFNYCPRCGALMDEVEE